MTLSSVLQTYSCAHILYLTGTLDYTHDPNPKDRNSCNNLADVSVITSTMVGDCYNTITQKVHTSSMSCIGLLCFIFSQTYPFTTRCAAHQEAINYQKQRSLRNNQNADWLNRLKRKLRCLYLHTPLIQKICIITSITLCTYYGNSSYLIGITAFGILKFAVRPSFLFSKKISDQLDSYLELLSNVIDVMFNPYLLFKVEALLRIRPVERLYNQTKSALIKYIYDNEQYFIELIERLLSIRRNLI